MLHGGPVLHAEYNNRVSRATRGSLISSRNNRVRQIRSDGSHPRNRPISLVPWTSCRPSPTSIVPDLSSMVHFYGTTTTTNGVSSTCFYTIAQVMWELLHFCPRFLTKTKLENWTDNARNFLRNDEKWKMNENVI